MTGLVVKFFQYINSFYRLLLLHRSDISPSEEKTSQILDNIDFKPLDSLIHKKAINIIISDIFDTILCRKVHPETIKKLVAAQLTNLFPEISTSDFCYFRKKAEHYCYKKSEISYGEREFNYAYLVTIWYKYLKKKYKPAIYLSKNEFFSLCQSLELAIERHNQIPDQKVINFLKKQKGKGKKIILLSDFYMSGDLVNTLLASHQIDTIYDHLIVSSDLMKTKRSGQIYQAILNNPALCHSNRIVMMGDNYYSDILMAKQFRLKTFHIDRKQQKMVYKQQLQRLLSKKSLLSDLHTLIDDADGLFDHFPLLLFYIVNKLYHQCIKRKINKLYFIAREGKIIKDLFDQYQQYRQDKGFNISITTYYLLASRRSTAAAGLEPLESEEFTTLFRQYVTISIKQFALSYSFDIEKIENICKSLNIDINAVQDHLPSSDSFKRLKKDSNFIHYYNDFRIQQRNNFLTYLKTINFTLDEEQLTLFDVGWKGSIQDNISKILHEKKINGYYLGLCAAGSANCNNIKEGLLFDFRHKNINYRIYTENLSLFEIILNADHGSVKKYDRKENGEILVDLEVNNQEKWVFSQKASLIQQKIHTNFTKLLPLFDQYAFGVNEIENHLAKMHKKKIFSPNKNEMEWVTGIRHFENFGLFTYSQISNDSTDSLKTQKHFMKFLKSPRKYTRSTFWPSLQMSKDGCRFLAILYKYYTLYLR